ncbi:hypothetical protein KIH87_18935 [Paraneptunicella aestuarii]|uniref:hypothetical protein n=1 Tax=Paraneptunicella aestuarii TaxID=2831148 RepID=UPI001E2DD1F7|nr:hypothetical protein [Paraneptunicella aestuarii]UAA38710.1 hypothetical protein KIH87_18935 [Paraneptunicella aestuarii]
MANSRAVLSAPFVKCSFFFSAFLLLVMSGCSASDAVSQKEHARATEKPSSELNFTLQEGRNLSAFYRNGSAAAHVIMSNGNQPRLITAFPAGNSGIGLWFNPVVNKVEWQISQPLKNWQFVEQEQSYHGIDTELTVTGSALEIRKVVMGSIRVLREYQRIAEVPVNVDDVLIGAHKKHISWHRNRLDGQAGYKVSIDVLEGSIALTDTGYQLQLSEQGVLRMRLRAATSETPLTPLSPLKLEYQKDADPKQLNSLNFLTYQEKMLAGSWRFLTYFGRDTLLSLRMLMPALTDDAIEAVLSSVLERMSEQGRVAHEEDIGEFALLRHIKDKQKEQGGNGSSSFSDSPYYDYDMLDDDLMLLPIISKYLLSIDGQKAKAFLQRTRSDGQGLGDLLSLNLSYAVNAAEAFYQQPDLLHLIGLPDGHYDGNWRDSEEGLGGAKYPFDVNAILMPAALEAGAQLLEKGLLSVSDTSFTAQKLRQMAMHWQSKVPPLFETKVSQSVVEDNQKEYAKRLSVSVSGKREAEPAAFYALALNEDGSPLPVMHSDTGFMLLFGSPSESQISQILKNVQSPFPYGLMTPIGMLVSNPVYAGEEIQHLFGRDKYHGIVVWSWQQAMMLVGIERQLERDDLTKQVRAELHKTKDMLWQVVKDTEQLKSSELWSWSVQDGQYQMEAFGQRRSDITESNPAQLWSTVFLAL